MLNLFSMNKKWYHYHPQPQSQKWAILNGTPPRSHRHKAALRFPPEA